MELRTKSMLWEKRRKGENLGEINERGKRRLAGRPMWLKSEQRVARRISFADGKRGRL